jgi:gentisate 1,2-dioxygenase
MQEISPGSRSGKHRHLTEEQVLVIRGRGYDIHDGERWDWERGDLVSIPTMAEHQHFNADADQPALLLSSMPSAGVALGLGGIEQLEDAPEYSDTQRRGD